MAFAEEFIAACETNKKFREAFEKRIANAIRAEFGPAGQATGAIQRELATAFGKDGAYYKGDGVYDRFTETTYEQVDKVLDEHGLPKPTP